MLRGISDDGRLIANVVNRVYRNAAGEVQFASDPRRDAIEGKTWMVGWVQAIRRTGDGTPVLFVSQLVGAKEDSSPFNRPLRDDFENALFGTQGVPVTRFPIYSAGSILSTFFGEPGRLVIATLTSSSSYKLTEWDIAANRAVRTYTARKSPAHWDTAESDLMLFDGKGFIEGSLDLFRTTSTDSTGFFRIDQSSPPGLNRAWTSSGGGGGGLSLTTDGTAVAASYREGIVFWNFDGSMRSTVGMEAQSYRYVACVGESRLLFIQGRDYSELALVDAANNRVVAEKDLGSRVRVSQDKHFAPIQTADSGRYVAFMVSENSRSRVLVFRIENDAIAGPWRILDPETAVPLSEVSCIRASRNASWLAVEYVTYEDAPRIIAVDLDELTKSRPPSEM